MGPVITTVPIAIPEVRAGASLPGCPGVKPEFHLLESGRSQALSEFFACDLQLNTDMV